MGKAHGLRKQSQQCQNLRSAIRGLLSICTGTGYVLRKWFLTAGNILISFIISDTTLPHNRFFLLKTDAYCYYVCMDVLSQYFLKIKMHKLLNFVCLQRSFLCGFAFASQNAIYPFAQSEINSTLLYIRFSPAPWILLIWQGSRCRLIVFTKKALLSFMFYCFYFRATYWRVTGT